MDELHSAVVETEQARIFVRHGGTGPPLLLLHGFPQTHVMWRAVAPALASEFSVVCADLRGYGNSSCPPSAADHEPYSKRAMARDMVEVMTALGFDRFAVAGHDRGGRVAYRAALDHPDRVLRLAVLDVLPIDIAWLHADHRLMLGYWPWSLLAQPEPLPERLLAAAPDAVIDHILGGAWGTPADTFDHDVRAAYLAPLRAADHIHAICEEYRAAATIDRTHDTADRSAGRKVTQPVLALWSGEGPLASWYTDQGGPLALWRDFATDVRGHPVDGGHFFPEQHPERTVEAFRTFFGPACSGAG